MEKSNKDKGTSEHNYDSHALDAMIVDYEPMIMSIIKRLNIKYDIEDYMQVGRAAVYQAAVGFDPGAARGATLSQYIYTRIYQRVIDEIRRTSRYTSNVDVVEAVEEWGIFSSRDDYIKLLIHEAKTVLDKREIVWFELMLDGFSIAEISLVLGVSMSTVKNIRKSAREKLKGIL